MYNRIMKFNLAFTIILAIILAIVTNIFAQRQNNSKTLQVEKLLHQALTEDSLGQKIFLLKNALRKAPNNSMVQFVLGKLLCSKNDQKNGIPLLLKAQKNPRFTVRVLKFLANFHYEKKEFDKSAKYLSMIIRVKEGNSYLYNYRYAITQQYAKKYKAANYFFLRAFALRKMDDDKEILVNVADNYYLLKDYKRAFLYLKDYPYKNNNNQKALRLWIKATYKTNHLAKADSAIQLYIDTWGEDKWITNLQNTLNSE